MSQNKEKYCYECNKLITNNNTKYCTDKCRIIAAKNRADSNRNVPKKVIGEKFQCKGENCDILVIRTSQNRLYCDSCQKKKKQSYDTVRQSNIIKKLEGACPWENRSLKSGIYDISVYDAIYTPFI